MQRIVKGILKYKLWIIGAIILLVAAQYGYNTFFSKKKPALASQTIIVERGDISSVVSATGTLKPVNMVDVSSKITGLIKEVRVNENDQVKKGQILVALDDKRIRAQVAQAQARLANAEATYERNRRLNNIGAVAQQQFDASAMDYSVAQAAYDDVMSQLDDTVIKAPVDGTVIGKPIPAGQTVSPGISTPMVLLTIADMSKMQIDTQVDESDIGKVILGQKTTFTVDAFPDKIFIGVVSNISQKANIQQNVVYYNVTIDVESPQNILKPTMTARVSILVGESKNTLTIPLAAVKANKAQRYVQVVTGGQSQNVSITTGLANDERVEVLSGLNEGDKVLVSITRPQNQATGAGQPSANPSSTLRSIMGR